MKHILRKGQLFSTMSGVADMVGRSAADKFLKSMNSSYIDTPTICISDPAKASSWEWTVGLDR